MVAALWLNVVCVQRGALVLSAVGDMHDQVLMMMMMQWDLLPAW
jgi:hypothetical protein